MSHTVTAPAAPTDPDPNRAVSARLDFTGVAKIVHLLRTLFAYSRNLIATLRQEDDPAGIPWYAFLTRILATTHPVLITVFVIRGLLRLAMLQARLSSSPARLLRLPLREGAGGRGAGPRVVGWVITPCWLADGRLPTPPGGNVRENRNRGPRTPDRRHPPRSRHHARSDGSATWDELRRAITFHSGNPADSAGMAIPLAGQLTIALSAMAVAIPSSLPYLPTPNRPAGETDYRSRLWTNRLISEFASWGSFEPLRINRDFGARPLHVCPLSLIDTPPAQGSPAA